MTWPPRKPATPPIDICSAKPTIRMRKEPPLPCSPCAIIWTIVRVENTATGSFEPDSTSSVARTRSRIRTPPMRRRKNTAAASVDDTMAPSSSEASQSSPDRKCTAAPTIIVVATTPSVDRVSAGHAARVSVSARVPKPASNRMMASATDPMK